MDLWSETMSFQRNHGKLLRDQGRQSLEEALAKPDGLQRCVFDGYQHLLSVRIKQVAFHPKASMRVLQLPGDGLLGFVRTADDGEQVAVVANLNGGWNSG